MNVLLINPPEYSFAGFHNVHTYPIDLYNWATHYKNEGNTVKVLDMYPELANSSLVTNVAGDMYYDGIPVVEDIGIVRKCGNYENEQLVKGVLKTGFSYSILEDELKNNTYDRIVVCANGTKTSVSSASWIYVFMGVYEVINRCKAIQPNAIVELMGEYAKICPFASQMSNADISIVTPYPERHFINTDISLFDVEIPNRINIATSYGCSNQCAFCFIPKCEGSSRREKDPQKVIDYIGYLVGQGITKFRILDSNILYNWENHMNVILDGIISSGWNISLTSYGGIEPALFTDVIASKMKDAGFTDLNVPLDNSDQEVLDLWGGIKSVSAWENAVDIAKNYFNVSSYIMIGYPGQTYSNATTSISMCTNKGVTPAILPYTPIPGTIYEDSSKNPEELHPLLFPYASEDFTVAQMEALLEDNSSWYKKSTIKPDDAVQTKRIYMSSPAIPIN